MLLFRTQIFILLRSPGIESARLHRLSSSILRLLKSLQIQALLALFSRDSINYYSYLCFEAWCALRHLGQPNTLCLAYSLGGRIQLVPSFIRRVGELHIIHKYLMIALIADCGIAISYWSMNPSKYKPTDTNKQKLVLLEKDKACK